MTKGDWRDAGIRWLAIAALGIGQFACSEQLAGEALGASSQALTAPQARVLGFESVGAGASDWTTNSGIVSQSVRHVEGAGSLAIANGGNSVLTSAPLSSLGAVADKLTLDLLLPAAQPNPYWMGTIKLVIECPSQQLWYEALAEHQLQGRPIDQFLRFEFPLSAATRNRLSTGTYADLRFKVLLNVAAGAGPWLLDRLWVGEPASGGGGSGGAGASGGGGPTSESLLLSVHLPQGVQAGDFAVAAQGGPLLLGDGVVVQGDGVDFASVGNVSRTGGGTINVGSQAQLQDVQATGSVLLRNNALVHGSVIASGSLSQQSGALIEGSTRVPEPVIGSESLAWRVTFPATTSLLSVGNDQSQTVAPGNFGDAIVSARGRLRLAPGTYHFRSLLVEPQATLEMLNNDGPVILHIRDGLTYRGSITELDPTTPNVLFTIAGQRDVVLESAFRGTILAPEARILLGTSSVGHLGAFIGRSVEVGPWTMIRHRPFTRFSCASDDVACPASACSENGACAIDISTPTGAAPFQTALLATKRLVIGDHASVVGVLGSLPPTIVNSGPTATEIGRSAVVGIVNSKAPVLVGADALVQGYLVTSASASLLPGASVIGEARQGSNQAFEPWNWGLRVAASITDRIFSETSVLAVGAYRNVRVSAGATLMLSSGRYDFESLSVEDGGVLQVGAEQTRVNVRSRLRLDGGVVASGDPHFASLLLSYFGFEPLRVAGPFTGGLVAPSASIQVRGSDSKPFFGSALAPEIFILPGAKVSYLPLRPKRAPGVSGVNVVGQALEPESSKSSPVEVFRDNPFFAGAFPARTGLSGESTGTYSHRYQWHGVIDSQFDLSAFTGASASTPLFSGFGGLPSDGSGFPDPGSWHFRGGNFVPGNLYEFEAYSRAVPTFERTAAVPLWARLSDSVTVVPVVAIFWRDFADGATGGLTLEREFQQMSAVMDFLPVSSGARTFPNNQSTSGVDPELLLGARQIPPDDIWAQCGIQFRLVGTLALHRQGPPISCGEQASAFSSDVRAAIAASAPDLAALWFSEGGLDPFLLEVGQARGCPWNGNAIPSSRDAQLNRDGWSDVDNSVTIAHELGHILLGAGHSELGNLMSARAARPDVLLTKNQCASARSVAERYRRSFYNYALATGQTGVEVQNIPFDPGWLRVPVATQQPKSCCQIDGDYFSLTSFVCRLQGGTPAGDANCRTCCAINDPAFRDSGGDFNIQLMDVCEESRRLERAECEFGCCERDGVGTSTSRYACLAENGDTGHHAGRIVTDDEEARDLCHSVVH